MTAAHALADLVRIELADDARMVVRLEQPVDQRLQAIGLVDDDPGVLALVRGSEFRFQQLGRAANAAQGILDLVREVAQQLAIRFRAGRVCVPRVDTLSCCIDLAHLDRHGGVVAMTAEATTRTGKGSRSGRGAVRACLAPLAEVLARDVVEHVRRSPAGR